MYFKNIIGQEFAKKYITNSIKNDKVNHAYMFEGIDGIGKYLFAKEFGNILINVENAENSPDYIKIEPTGNSIKIAQIREIQSDIIIKPHSKYKMYIINHAEKMTIESQNALLKTIEEPPEYAIIILLTTNADTFLQTILSRCVMLNIRPVKEDIIKNQLTSQYGVGDYEARVAATFSNGNPGKAIKLATSEEFKELKQYVVGMFMSLEKGGMDIIGEAIKKTGTFKKQIDEYFSLMRIWFRDILVYKATKEEDQIIFQDEYMTIEKMSQTYSFDDINDILKAIDLAESRIKSNVNFDSTIEILLLSIKEKTSGK